MEPTSTPWDGSLHPPIIIAGINKLQEWNGSAFVDGLNGMCIGSGTVAVTFGSSQDDWDYSYRQSGACGSFYLTIQQDKSLVETAEYGSNANRWYKTDLNGNIVP